MTGRGRFLALLLALAALAFVAVYALWPPAPPPPPPAPAGAPGPAPRDPLAGIPGLEVQHYEVSGRSVEEIRAALDRVRPRDPNDGIPVDALSSWYISWRWPVRSDGSCDLGRAEIRFTASVRMPRLARPEQVPAPVRARWQAYVAVLASHEADHVRHAQANAGQVLRAIRASSCADADAAGRAAIRVLARWDLDYDRATRHGFTQGAHFP